MAKTRTDQNEIMYQTWEAEKCNILEWSDFCVFRCVFFDLRLWCTDFRRTFFYLRLYFWIVLLWCLEVSTVAHSSLIVAFFWSFRLWWAVFSCGPFCWLSCWPVPSASAKSKLRHSKYAESFWGSSWHSSCNRFLGVVVKWLSHSVVSRFKFCYLFSPFL